MKDLTAIVGQAVARVVLTEGTPRADSMMMVFADGTALKITSACCCCGGLDIEVGKVEMAEVFMAVK